MKVGEAKGEGGRIEARDAVGERMVERGRSPLGVVCTSIKYGTVCMLLTSEVRSRSARGCMVLLDSDVHPDDHGDGRHEGGTPAGSSGGRRWEVHPRRVGGSNPIR